MKPISFYIIFTAFFFLVFLVAAIGFECYRKPISSLLAKKFPSLRKVPWDTVSKGLAAAGFILFVKKVLYYIGFRNFIQTPASVWWANSEDLIILCCLFILALSLMEARVTYLRSAGKIVLTVIMLFIIILFLIKPTFLIYLLLSPLLFLKMLCPGKYWGLLTSFLVGSYIVDRYKKLKPGITERNAKFLIMPALIIVFMWVIIFLYFPGDLHLKFGYKIRAAKSEAAVEELLDAVHTITASPTKTAALREILRADDIPWSREALWQAFDEAMTIKSNIYKAKILKDLALVIARTGDRKWAESIADGIKTQE